MEHTYLKLFKTNLGSITIHTLQSPEEGEAANAQIIETTNKLVVIDTLQLRPFANELRNYASSLKKPIERIIVTHYHPDHWMGTASFKGIPIYAFKEVIERITGMYDFVIGFHADRLAEKASEMLPQEKVLPTIEINEGVTVIDDVKFNFIKSVNSEAPVILITELPDFDTLLPQDMVYHKNHAWFGDRTPEGELGIKNWINDIRTFQKKNYKHVIPGHGTPTNGNVFPEVIEYLEFCQKQYDKGLQGEELVNSIVKQYPDYGLVMTLQMTNYMLFEYKE
jgi:hypothetical protein